MASSLTYLKMVTLGFDHEADRQAHLLFNEFWNTPLFPEECGYNSTLLAI